MGENIESGTVASIKIKVGDSIEENQVVLELETDKAVVDIPAPATGTISKLLINEGDEVKIGQVLFVLDEGGAPTSQSVEEKQTPAVDSVVPAAMPLSGAPTSGS